MCNVHTTYGTAQLILGVKYDQFVANEYEIMHIYRAEFQLIIAVEAC